MGKGTKRELKKLWLNCLWLSIISLLSVGAFMWGGQIILEYRSQHPRWALELAQAVEELTNEKSSAKEKEQALSEIAAIAQERELLLTISLSQFLHLLQETALARNQLSEAQDREMAWIQSNSFISIVKMELEKTHGLTLQQGSYLKALLKKDSTHSSIWLMLGLQLVSYVGTLLVSLFWLYRLTSLHNLSPTAQSIAFLPEECVAELGILKRRLQKAKASPWEIRWRLLTEFLTLLWVFYVPISLENLWLPSSDREIDD